MLDDVPILYLKRLTVRHLRNVKTAELELACGQNLLVGGNGQGKTTLLEAMYLLSAVRSFRGSRPVELIQHGVDKGSSTGLLEWQKEPASRVSVSLQRGVGRKVDVDGKKADLPHHFRRFPMVAFQPGDLNLVFGGPSERRRFLDRMLFQAQPGYADWHRGYRRALRSRNELLRTGGMATQIRAFDRVLASLGAPIGKARAEIVENLGNAAEGILEELGVPVFDISFEFQIDPIEEVLDHALENSLAGDRIRGRTRIGPHTDDLVIAKREGRAREVASRGEARALIVALRLAERQVLSQCATSIPLLLLDDVAAELDRVRAAKVIEMVKNQEGQVVVTATGSAEEGFGFGWRHFEICDGAVTETLDRAD